jgi:C1A family cysteine protease
MKKSVSALIAAVLLFLPSFSEAGDFQALRVDMEAKIQALRKEVKAQGGTFEVGYSAAMDKSIDQLCGLRVPQDLNKSDPPSAPMLSAAFQPLPSAFNWRSLHALTPVKNQGACGACWAFGTVGPLESQILIQDGISVDLSEQFLISCNLEGWNCNGGSWAHDYHMDRSAKDNNGTGAVLEADKLYKGFRARCGGPFEHPYRISNWAYVASPTAVPTVQAIKQAIYAYGPIAAGVYVGPKFHAYTGGIFNTSESGPVNHAIVLVGWNDDLGKDNGYWILRNSWGESWGESGYMRIRYKVNKVGYSANFIEYAGGNTPVSPPPVTKPDLAGEFVKLYTGDYGKALYGTFQVRNQGTGATENPFRVFLYLSKDGVTKNTLLGSATVSASLDVDSIFNLRISKSSTSSSRGKYAICVVDPDNAVSESKEGNNVIVKVIP